MSNTSPDHPLRLMVVGAAGSGAGKSTVCLSILANLLETGRYQPEDIAYIKPCTQGIQPTLVAKWCQTNGVPYRHVGPVVFFRGFTKAFLEGSLNQEDYVNPEVLNEMVTAETGNGEAQQLFEDPSLFRELYTRTLRKWIKDAVDEISANKKFVLIDGVGYPGVGSICGVCNGTVARVCKANVLILGKAGLGDCIDSWNVARTYMEEQLKSATTINSEQSSKSRVLGLLVTRVRTNGEMKKTQSVPLYFNSSTKINNYQCYGIIREQEDLFKEASSGDTSLADDNYAPPGKSSTCHISFKPVEHPQVAPKLSEGESELCKGLAREFLIDIGGVEGIDKLVEDCRKEI